MIFLLVGCEVSNDTAREQPFSGEDELRFAIDQFYVEVGKTRAFGSHGSLFTIQELSSDEAMMPRRCIDRFDGGIWQKIYRHEFEPLDGGFLLTWDELYALVTEANKLLTQLEDVQPDPLRISRQTLDEYTSEVRAMRAYLYFWLLDTFGNVPIVDDFETLLTEVENHPDFQQGRIEVFNFVEQELLESIPLLSDDLEKTYGRMNKFGALTLLGKLYLNAEVYTGTPRYEDAIEQFDKVIESGNYYLEPDYFENFKVQNEGSTENIFSLRFDDTERFGLWFHMIFLHEIMMNHQDFTLKFQPFNFYNTLESFYEKFEEADKRREGFFVGLQLGRDGKPLTDPRIDGESSFANSDCPDNTGPEVVLQVEVNQLTPNASFEAGARFGKFEIEPEATFNMNNDLPLFRYSDVLLSKGEALYRTGRTGEALPLINQVRERAGLAPLAQLTARDILDERGRELHIEMWRRQDLIRFEGQNGGVTAFNDPWEFKEISEPFKNVFPIPERAIDENPKLTQNPGY